MKDRDPYDAAMMKIAEIISRGRFEDWSNVAIASEIVKELQWRAGEREADEKVKPFKRKKK